MAGEQERFRVGVGVRSVTYVVVSLSVVADADLPPEAVHASSHADNVGVVELVVVAHP